MRQKLVVWEKYTVWERVEYLLEDSPLLNLQMAKQAIVDGNNKIIVESSVLDTNYDYDEVLEYDFDGAELEGVG